MSDIFEQLREPFSPGDIEWRIQRSGIKDGKPWAMVVAYVTNRAIMDRLDEVVGPARWQNMFESLPDGAMACGIGIELDGRWIWKWDGADKTDIEATKGGLSSAMKRAGVQWGIGRYLYHLPKTWADFCEDGIYRDAVKTGKDDHNPRYYRWSPPTLPTWALPKAATAPRKPDEMPVDDVNPLEPTLPDETGKGDIF